MIRKMIAVLLSVLVLSVPVPAAFAADNGADIFLDGSILDTKALVNGQTVYLPVRAVCQALGYEVTWSDSDGVQAAAISKDGDRITLGLTRQEVDDNGHTYAAGVYSGSGIVILSGRMYIDSGLFASVFPVGSSYDSKDNRVTIRRHCENNVTITTERMTSQKEHLLAKIQYPQLSGLADADILGAINAVLKQSALNALNQGEQNASDMAQAIRDGYTGAVGMCETFFDYFVQYNQNGLFSLVLTNYQYAGGAHGSTVQSSYTFDLSTGKALRLSDLMTRDSGYTRFINAAIRKEIDRRAAAGELYEFEFSKFKDIGENPEFYLSHDAIVFYFQEYAYFPYAAGIQEFKVNFTELSGMLKKEYRFLFSTPVILDPKAVNMLLTGEIGQAVLEGNATTGYTWHETISDNSVLTLVSACYRSSARPGVVGAGGTYTWSFKALTAGEATVTFKYYRDWEGEASAKPENTVVFNIAVT